MHVFGPLICGHGKQARAVEVCSYVTGAQEKACVHQWHLRNTWRQVLSLLHLQVRGLKLDSTEVWRIRILAIVRGLERGEYGCEYGELRKATKNLRKRLVTQLPRQHSNFSAGSCVCDKIDGITA